MQLLASEDDDQLSVIGTSLGGVDTEVHFSDKDATLFDLREALLNASGKPKNCRLKMISPLGDQLHGDRCNFLVKARDILLRHGCFEDERRKQISGSVQSAPPVVLVASQEASNSLVAADQGTDSKIFVGESDVQDMGLAGSGQKESSLAEHSEQAAISDMTGEIDEAAILRRTQEASVETLGRQHGENLPPLGRKAEQWLKQYGTKGHRIVERLSLDAGTCETTYCAWCIQAKKEIEAAKSGVESGDKVCWQASDKDIPPGSVGTVSGFEGGLVWVTFPKGKWRFDPEQLQRQVSSSVQSAPPVALIASQAAPISSVAVTNPKIFVEEPSVQDMGLAESGQKEST